MLITPLGPGFASLFGGGVVPVRVPAMLLVRGHRSTERGAGHGHNVLATATPELMANHAADDRAQYLWRDRSARRHHPGDRLIPAHIGYLGYPHFLAYRLRLDHCRPCLGPFLGRDQGGKRPEGKGKGKGQAQAEFIFPFHVRLRKPSPPTDGDSIVARG